MNNLDTKDIDNIFGTHLSTIGATVNNTQDAINAITPVVNFISKYWILVFVAIFATVFCACLLANKVK